MYLIGKEARPMLEHELAFYCSPAFAGIKPSNILSYSTNDKPRLKKQIDRLNSQLNSSGIYIKILCEYEKRVLIMVYRPGKLGSYINRPEIAAFLNGRGYVSTSDVEGCLKRLSERIRTSGEFPHEIGAFLGYPIADIYGFINHKNEGCKYTGHWKVYANVEEAKKTFKKYDSCRNAVISRLNCGKTLTDMFTLVKRA